MSECFLAEDTYSGTHCDLRMLPRLREDYAAQSRARDGLVRLLRLGHPGIVATTDFGVAEDGTPFVVSELVDGQTLDELLSRLRPTPDEAASLGVAVCDALAAAHAQGVHHEGLTPADIVVPAEGLGAARVTNLLAATLEGHDPDAAESLFGSPPYMAPERWQREATAAASAADVFALCTIVWEVIAGRPAFAGETLLEVARSIMTGRPPDLAEACPGVSRELAAVLSDGMRREPALRPTLAELRARLERAGRRQEHTGSFRMPAAASGPRVEPPPALGPARWDEPTGSSVMPAPSAAPRAAAPAHHPDPRQEHTGSMARPAPSEVLATPPAGWPLGDTVPDRDRPSALDENVQFTVYRPRSLVPGRWQKLLAFAHLGERPADAPPDEPDPIEEVERQAAEVLREEAAAYGKLSADSASAIPREGEITLTVSMPGVEIHPAARSFLWLDPVHREQFLLRAPRSLEGTTVRGRLTVFLGSLLLAEVPLQCRVESATGRAPPRERAVARPYRRIFASYSHRDLAIVEQVESYARALGDEYLRDLVHLRSGELWNDRLRTLIEAADVFQLFWSSSSMYSPFVRQEWEHALSLGRPAFVRPTFWEDPLPEDPARDLPPAALRRLHFQKLGRLAGPHLAPIPFAVPVTSLDPPGVGWQRAGLEEPRAGPWPPAGPPALASGTGPAWAGAPGRVATPGPWSSTTPCMPSPADAAPSGRRARSPLLLAMGLLGCVILALLVAGTLGYLVLGR